MFLSKLKKNDFCIPFFLLMQLASCCRSCFDQEMLQIPCDWHTPLEDGMSSEDPSCFPWWEVFHDSLLTTLIEEAALKNNDVHLAALQSREKLLDTMNIVAGDIAKSYFELRGFQENLKGFQKQIEAQKQAFRLSEGLSTTGFIGGIDQNEYKNTLNSLFEQKALIELSIDKKIFHLSALLGYPPGELYETLSPPQGLPKFPDDIPVGSPSEAVQSNPGVKEARKAFEKTRSKEAFYNYRKKVLELLEEIEDALAAVHYGLEKTHRLESIQRIKAEVYRSTTDLYQRGVKSDRDVQTAYQELLRSENALTQSRVELLIDIVNLFQAQGGGWQLSCRCL